METFEEKLIFFVMLLIAITMHEFGHAFAAAKLGDPLPRIQGRVTLNPMAHADPIGTFLFPLIMIFSGVPFLIGWGKPVQVSLPNPKTRMRDDLVSTAAGPLVNLGIAAISAILGVIAFKYEIPQLMLVAKISLVINCVLLIFNMLPIPPLDGSHFLRYAVNMSAETYQKLSKFSLPILIGLLVFTPLGEYLGIAINSMANLLLTGSYYLLSFII